ncbi:Bisphosphoglycerate mutase, partial [Lamprotornis superbus]
MAKYRLVLLRHGEGAWTKENRFCSWVDQKLSSDGIKEAQNCGKHLKALGFEFDLVFTSVLSRSIQTAWLILEEMGQEWVPIQSSWRLNERHYGALIGLNRAEMALNHGEEQVKIWRRSYDVTPPPISESHPYYAEIYNDRRYKCGDVSQENLPKAESLKDVLDRLLPYWNEKIVPELKSGKMILISAHGNSSRALLKHVEGISDEDIINVTLPTGVPILLELDENLHPLGPHQFLGDQEAIQAAIKKVEDQGKIHSRFTRLGEFCKFWMAAEAWGTELVVDRVSVIKEMKKLQEWVIFQERGKEILIIYEESAQSKGDGEQDIH